MIDFTKHSRFWKKVNIGKPDECWNFHTRNTGEDYGYFNINFRSVRAHRVAYEIAYGEIPTGLLVCHHCDNKSCCNPFHLFLGTHTDNAKDLVAKGLFHPKGTPMLGEKNASSKLTNEQIVDIRESFARGDSRKQIAKRHKTSVSNIGAIVTKKRWKHI